MRAVQAPVDLEARLKLVLPEQYQDSCETVQPTPMGSAALKFDAGGRVAWDQMWATFCDLAMAGGPPHKGTLLAPGTEDAIDADFDRYDTVADEICRGVGLVTGLRAYPSETVGWVSLTCLGDTMADWLLRAITVENVAVRRSGAVLSLPAAPHFRLEKEIKNVVTVVAKTCHYWLGHVPAERQQAIGDLFRTLAHDAPLLAPDYLQTPDAHQQRVAADAAASLCRDTGLTLSARQHPHWLGLECGDRSRAIRMMRALIVCNVLARREETTLCVPANAAGGSGTRRLVALLTSLAR